eukprot:TRINITY_DN976_c0_g1_i2.p1 TRINITY_DN976_c0_g1~~TRINITY_DN976_c0_g1_i2.p1  ORF type:complete len:346 (-),score=62.87 TRINITY_DN976_c0_g1_i2:119-1156(-)
MVVPGFYLESAFFFLLGISGFCYALYQIRARWFPWNQQAGIKFLQRTFQDNLLFNGLITFIWGLDNRGVFGIYSSTAVIVMKDTLTCSNQIICAVWSITIYQFIETGVLHRPSQVKHPVIIVVLVFLFQMCLDAGVTYRARETQQEWYRGIWTCSLAVAFSVCGCISLISMCVYYNTSKKVSPAVQQSESRSKRAQRFFRKVSAIAVMCFIASAGSISYIAKRFSSGGPMREFEPENPNVFTFDLVNFMLVLGILAGFINSGIPQTDPSAINMSDNGTSKEGRRKDCYLIMETVSAVATYIGSMIDIREFSPADPSSCDTGKEEQVELGRTLSGSHQVQTLATFA